MEDNIMSTFEKIRTAIAAYLEIDESEITEKTTFADLGVDSLDTVEIMMELEDAFGVEIKADEAGQSVADLTKYIEAKLA
jgi:acyl carrier protein